MLTLRNMVLTLGDSKLTVGLKVWLLATQLGIKGPELAKAMRVDRTTPYSWKGKRSINPTMESLDHLIEYIAKTKNIEVPRAWFFDGKRGDAPISSPGVIFLKDQESATHASGSLANMEEVSLPLWRGVMAGDDGECMFDEESPEYISIPAFITGGKSDGFVVGVASGFSMYPRVAPGEHIVIKIDPNPPLNAIVVARSEGKGNFIKAFRKVADRGTLESLNPEFKTIEDLTGWTLRGYAIAVLKKYEGGSPNIEWDFGRPLRA